MKKILRSLQHGVTASVLTVALFVTGAAALAVVDTGLTEPSSSSSPAGETTTTTDLAVGSQMAVPIADAGVVTVVRTADSLSLVSAIADPGWQAVIEVDAGRELEVSFRSPTTRHDVNIELEDGQVRTRIRTRANSTSSTDGASTGSTSTSTIPGSSTSTTSTLPDSSTTSTTTLPSSSAERHTIVVLDAGTADFVVESGQLKIVGTTVNPGWAVTVERSVGREVEASWRGDGRVDLNLELEDGEVRVRIRDRRIDVRTEERIPIGDGGASSTSTTSTIPSSSTVPTSTTTPTSSTTVPDTSVPDRTEVANSTGGTVTVTISGNTVMLVSAVPSPGYAVDVRDHGGDKVEVRFENDDRESRIKLEMHHGTLRREIEDR